METRPIKPEDRGALSKFFTLLKDRAIDKLFHPHPLTDESALERASYKGKDFYAVLVDANQIVGYGMLRGWDEGFEIPSLGIAIHPDLHRQGKGRLMMNYLHDAARQRGAKKIRLKVCPHNRSAVNLYRKLGYDLIRETNGQYLIGFLDLMRIKK